MRLVVEHECDDGWRWFLGWRVFIDSDFVEANTLSEAIDASLARIESHLGITASEILVDGTHIVVLHHRGTHEWRTEVRWRGGFGGFGDAIGNALTFTGRSTPSSIELTIGAATYRKPEGT